MYTSVSIKSKAAWLLMFFVLAVVSTQAQKFFKAQLVLTNHTQLEGFVQPPGTPNDKRVKFKSTENAEVRKIESTTIQLIIVHASDGSQSVLERIPINKKNTAFCFLMVEGYADLYLTGDIISVSKTGELSPSSSYVVGRSLPYFTYLIRRPGETYVSELAMTSPSKTMLGAKKYFRKLAAAYFSDYPALVERINDEEFTEKDVERVVAIYNDYKKDK